MSTKGTKKKSTDKGKSKDKDSGKSKSSKGKDKDSSKSKGKGSTKGSSKGTSKAEIFDSRKEALKQLAKFEDDEARKFNERVDEIVPPIEYDTSVLPTKKSIRDETARAGFRRITGPHKESKKDKGASDDEDEGGKKGKKSLKTKPNTSKYRNVHETSQLDMLMRKRVADTDEKVEELTWFAQACRPGSSQVTAEHVSLFYGGILGTTKGEKRRVTKSEGKDKGEGKEKKDKSKSASKKATPKKGKESKEAASDSSSDKEAKEAAATNGESESQAPAKGSTRGRKRKAGDADGDDADSGKGRASKRAKTTKDSSAADGDSLE